MKVRAAIARIALLLGVSALGMSLAWGQDATPGATVKLKQGETQGMVVDGVEVFKGLPYAAPPVGDLRWRAPHAPAKWKGVRVADKFGPSCQAAEDCLYLNVYAPTDATPKSKLPVMVWIHGGAFIFGSGSYYNGTQFAKQGLIVVTINYRLGRAGYFAHPALTAESPEGPLGNYGLLDQIAALQWVQDNIGQFGGDNHNVTAFGESAGAISVNYLMLAPQARGLFQKAIAESGFGRLAAMPLHTDDGTPSAEKIGIAFAERNGIKGSDAKAAKALRALSWADLNKGMAPIGSPEQILPMADGQYIKGSAVDGFSKGLEAHVPYMVGGNSDEASLTRRGFDPVARMASITQNRDAFLAAFDPDKTGDAAHIMAHLVTDSTISEPDRALARAHSKLGLPTYVYHFSYVPESMRSTALGMPHGGELAYVFDTPRRGGQFDAEGQAIANAANRYWGAFAKTSDPDSAGGPKWPKFEPGNETLIEFGSSGKPEVHKDFHKARLDWVEESIKR